MSFSTLEEVVVGELRKAGLSGRLVSKLPGTGDAPFGDSEVIFWLGKLLIKVSRDRGLLFVDVSSARTPASFYQFCDIEIALGLRSIEQVLALEDVEPIDRIFAFVASHAIEIERVFEVDGIPSTAKLDIVTSARACAFKERICRLAESASEA